MIHIPDIHEILYHLHINKIKTWIDGGWGVDALLGTQTRPHDDLDLVISESDRERLLAALPSFHHDLTAEPGMPIRYVLKDSNGRTIDFHPVIFDSAGNGLAIPDGTHISYPAEYLTGTGEIGGRSVACLTAEAQVTHHSGYVNHGPDEFDYQDMRNLSERFGLALPPEYSHPPNWQHPRRKNLAGMVSGHHLGALRKKRIFITGTSTAGKSYLARKLADETGGIPVELDLFWVKLIENERYVKWREFDERAYYLSSPENQWKIIVDKAEDLWPELLAEIRRYENEERPVIFECAYILPHLAKRDLEFPGVTLIGRSYEESLARIIARHAKYPGWESPIELQELRSKHNFEVARPDFAREARKYGYEVFENGDSAFAYALKILLA